MAYPTFFLGSIPEIPEELEESTPQEIWEAAFQASSQYTVNHLWNHWQDLLVLHRGQVSRVYTDLVKGRLDWLYDIFDGTTPDPTGELAE